MSGTCRRFANAVRVLLAAGLVMSVTGPAEAQGVATAEAERYESFFESTRTVKIPKEAIDPAGFAVVHFPMAEGRGLSLELDLGPVGPGTYTLSLSAMSNIVVPTVDGRGRKAGIGELTAALAQTDFLQNVFCRRTDGMGGAVAFAEIPATTPHGETVAIAAMISNDGLAHADQKILAECSAGTSDQAVETQGDRVWCISWFSSMCFDKGPGMRRCDFEACDVTMAALVDLAGAAGVTIPPLLDLPGAIDWLSRKLGLRVGGYCAKVYFLDIISVGCQCVLHTF